MKQRIMTGSIAFTLAVFVVWISAAPAWADGGAAHQVSQARPISLGTSGSNINDSSAGFCCGGTLGSLVQNSSGTQFILSNNHVLARTNLGTTGEDIIQPGLIDQNPVCNPNATDTVATLSQFVPISFRRRDSNTVDAALAQVVPGDVDPGGSILDIGQVRTTAVAPALNAAVKKSGRTTGLTTGTITSLNATVRVTYNKTCGVGSQTTTFTGQFIVSPGSFSAGGDSGSLIVENVATCPRPVGLLFAGSSTSTIANPIDAVLSALNVTPVGCAAGASPDEVKTEEAMNLDILAASAVQTRYADALMEMEGVVGTAVGVSSTKSDQVTIQVLVKEKTGAVMANLPLTLEGIPVEVVETGEFVAY